MKITIDTDKDIIIVPDNYFDKIDNMNELIRKTGGNELDYVNYIKDSFEKSIAKKDGIKRRDDVKQTRNKK